MGYKYGQGNHIIGEPPEIILIGFPKTLDKGKSQDPADPEDDMPPGPVLQ